MIAGAPDGSVAHNICSAGKFLLAGTLMGKMICPWKESVAGKETAQGV